MQFDFFALSTTLIDTAKLQLLPDTVSTYVHLCLFMSIYVHLLFLKCCNSVCGFRWVKALLSLRKTTSPRDFFSLKGES